MVVGLLGIFVLVSRSLNMYHTAAQEYVATNLAAEGIEVTKNILDSNLIKGRAWNDGFAVTEAKYYGIQYDSKTLADSGGSPDKYLLYDSAKGLYGYDTNTGKPSVYKRKITITNAPEDKIQVNSEVTYTISTGATFNINLEDHFYNWR
jgi:arginine/lysine/ornithine decarboxylase